MSGSGVWTEVAQHLQTVPRHPEKAGASLGARKAVRQIWLLVLLLGVLGYPSLPAPWKPANRNDELSFPRDHYSHPDQKTEWWYFVGHLEGEAPDDRFGFQLTLFRQGLRPPGEQEGTSKFLANQFYFGHFAVSDLEKKQHHGKQRILRGSFAEAGCGAPGEDTLIWLEDWKISRSSKGVFRVEAAIEGQAIDLQLTPTKAPVLQGDRGFSLKSGTSGNASHYFSQTRLAVSGDLVLGTQSRKVTGDAWMDREWSTGILDRTQIGWDWFALQFEDGSEMMLFQVRDRDDPDRSFPSGTYVARDGSTTRLEKGDFTLKPVRFWTSGESEGHYPVEWEVQVQKPEAGIDRKFKVEAAFDSQEMALGLITYWEGAVKIQGSGTGSRGRGYLEMTGYAGELIGLGQAE